MPIILCLSILIGAKRTFQNTEMNKIDEAAVYFTHSIKIQKCQCLSNLLNDKFCFLFFPLRYCFDKSFAFWPLLLQMPSRRFKLHDESNNNFITFWWLFCTALWRAVLPSLSWWKTSAPFRSKSSTTCSWPSAKEMNK